jgi:peroxiredoxin Q/BCP
MPSFALIDHAERMVASDDFAGRWYLLYWYPKADTPGCTAQAIGLRDQHDAFEALDCTVLGASFDEPADNAAFRAKFGLPFRLLSDRERGVARRVGAADDDGATHAQRIAHLVRPDGKIERSYLVEDPEFFAEQVLDDLEAAQGDGVG